MTITKFLLKNLKKCKKLFIFLFLTFSISNAIPPLENYISSRFIGCFELANKTDALNRALLILTLLVIFYLIRALINGYYNSYLKEAFGSVFMTHSVSELFCYVHKHSISYFDDEMSGRVSSAISNFSSSLFELLSDVMFNLVRPLTGLIVSFAIIASFSPFLSLSFILICIPYFFAVYYTNIRFFNLSADSTKSARKVGGIVTDSLSNSNLVKFTGSFFTEQLYLYKHLKENLHHIVKQEQFHAVSRFVFHAIDTVFLTIGLLIVLYRTQKDHISLENLFFVYTSLFGMVMAILQLNNFCQYIAQVLGDLKANYDIINKPISIKDKDDAYTLTLKKVPNITLSNINFSYVKGKTVFKNLNLSIKAGEKVGLVGFSGSGKSTLINLILRNYDVNSGEILINKHKITDITQDSLHKNIAVVSQENALFNRSLLENLKIARPSASLDEIKKACQITHIDDFIENLPDGYNSVVGERGVLLSGGERQRIAIARAILQKAPILILDEATSSLDSESEVAIVKALDHMMQNKTVIAIAHRLSTLNNMDRIIVLNNGKIIEDGPKNELLKQKTGIFYQLYQKQANGYLVYGEE